VPDGTASELLWSRLDLTQPAGIEEALAVSKRAAEEVGLAARSFSLEWRRGAAADWSALRVFVLRQDRVPLGLAVFSLNPRPLKFQVGEVSIGAIKLTRHWHLAEPYLARELAPELAGPATEKLLRTCLAGLGAGEALFFEGLPSTSPLNELISGAAAADAGFVKLELGLPFAHQFIRMPDTFAEYLVQLGSRSRQSVLYSQRRLIKDMAGEVRCECFETEAAVERFITDARQVSRKTYQWNLLGLGLRDPEALRRKFTATARAGWWRSYILYCKGLPVAFMLGDQQGDCYYYDDVGYDPEYAKASVGSVLQIMVLEDLLGRADRPRYFDFSTGYGEHKGRFGNIERTESNVLVLPRTLRNRSLVGAFRLNTRVTGAAVGLIERFGLKERIKKLIRRRSART
jgi:hypothetical protein